MEGEGRGIATEEEERGGRTGNKKGVVILLIKPCK